MKQQTKLVGYKLPESLIKQLDKERTAQIGQTGRDMSKSQFVEQLLTRALGKNHLRSEP